MPIEHIREYTIDCTGDVCQGDVILFSGNGIRRVTPQPGRARHQADRGDSDP